MTLSPDDSYLPQANIPSDRLCSLSSLQVSRRLTDVTTAVCSILIGRPRRAKLHSQPTRWQDVFEDLCQLGPCALLVLVLKLLIDCGAAFRKTTTWTFRKQRLPAAKINRMNLGGFRSKSNDERRTSGTLLSETLYKNRIFKRFCG